MPGGSLTPECHVTIYVRGGSVCPESKIFIPKSGQLDQSFEVAQFTRNGGSVWSGISKLLPNDSLVINIDVKRLVKNVRDYSPGKLKVLYYYFEKRGQSFDGLVNISKNKLVRKSDYIE